MISGSIVNRKSYISSLATTTDYGWIDCGSSHSINSHGWIRSHYSTHCNLTINELITSITWNGVSVTVLSGYHIRRCKTKIQGEIPTRTGIENVPIFISKNQLHRITRTCDQVCWPNRRIIANCRKCTWSNRNCSSLCGKTAITHRKISGSDYFWCVLNAAR